MICPNCHAEYRDGFSTCADCQVPLVNDLSEVPAGVEESAEEEGAFGAGGFSGALGGGAGELAPLAEIASTEMLGTLLEQFEERQIPYVVQAGTALALASGRDLESPGFPDPWRARVLVEGSFRREAKALVDALVAEAKRQTLAGLG